MPWAWSRLIAMRDEYPRYRPRVTTNDSHRSRAHDRSHQTAWRPKPSKGGSSMREAEAMMGGGGGDSALRSCCARKRGNTTGAGFADGESHEV
jgi:hypothetical protein